MNNTTNTTNKPRARIRQLKLGDTARAELEAHRDALHARMEELQEELNETEQQYKHVTGIVGWKIDITFGTRVPNSSPLQVAAPTLAKRKTGPRNHNMFEGTLIALDAAGKAGITSRELMGVTQVPSGTAGARLSLLKKEGKVAHVGNRYYLPHFIPNGAMPRPMAQHIRVSHVQVVHSQQEDNNTTQGGEGIANHG